MKKQLRITIILIIFAFSSIALIGCDGSGSGEVIIFDDGYSYEPAVIQNTSFDDIILETGPFGDILLVPGTEVVLDVGPDVYCIGVYINGIFFEEICVASGDLIIFE